MFYTCARQKRNRASQVMTYHPHQGSILPKSPFSKNEGGTLRSTSFILPQWAELQHLLNLPFLGSPLLPSWVLSIDSTINASLWPWLIGKSVDLDGAKWYSPRASSIWNQILTCIMARPPPKPPKKAKRQNPCFSDIPLQDIKQLRLVSQYTAIPSLSWHSSFNDRRCVVLNLPCSRKPFVIVGALHR